MTTRRVTWRRSQDPEVDEHCTLTVSGSGLSLAGTVVGAEQGVPLRVEYDVQTGPTGFTTQVHVDHRLGCEQRTLHLARDGEGRWTVDDAHAEALAGCTDVDLGCTPSTNTLPMRRMDLAVGAAATVHAAWVRFPDLTVTRSVQTYTRLDERAYRYSSGAFEATLTVDDLGLVVAYDAWRRTGVAQCPG